MTDPLVGSVVSDFSAPMTSAQTFRLSDYAGKQAVVLYFYPKDHTPGCTTQAQDFSAAYADFQAASTVVVGVSRDSLKVHESFRSKHALPFELIADPDEVVCEQFAVMKLKNLYGKQVRGIERSTFLIDRDGVLRQEWRKVKVNGHVAAVLAAVQAL